MMEKNKNNRLADFYRSRMGKRMIFYVIICFLPVLQFCLFTFYVNFNSIKMAFETYDYASGANGGYGVDGIIKTFAGFDNFKMAWQTLVDRNYMLKNSLWLFLSKIVITIPLALIFSFYLCKKCRFSGFFKVILYMPNIVSPMIFALLFQRIINLVYPEIMERWFDQTISGSGLLVTGNNPSYGIVLFFNIWVSFGINILMFSGAMSGINESVIESAHLDGANVVQEFWYITLPMIFSTVSTFIILAMAGIFTDQMHLFTFFNGEITGLETVGYYIYLTAQKTDYVVPEALAAKFAFLSYPQLAALGLLLTLIIAPITFLTRKLFEKYGPSEN